MSQTIIDYVAKQLHPFFESNGFEVYDIDFIKEGSNWYLRVLVDKNGGISLEDCGDISHFLSEKLDEHDPIEQAYILEVSSPGIERPLKSDIHFHDSINHEVFVEYKDQNGEIKEIEGILIESNDNQIVVQKLKTKVEIEKANITFARRAIKF